MSLLLVRPAPGGVPSGGTVYDERLLAELARLGIDCADAPLPGRWPEPDAAARAGLAAALADAAGPVVVDGLVGSGCPDELAAAADAGARLTLLVHLPLAAEPGLPAATRARYQAAEQASLGVVERVVVPSAFAARDLAGRFRLRRAPVVARPGQEPAPVASGSEPPLLVMVGAFSPGKNHALALSALAGLLDRPWQLALVGGEPARDSTLPEVRRLLAGTPALAERTTLAGVRVGPELAATWAAADLLLVPSLVETYGMVVSEGLARGVPALVAAGTGAVEALAGPDAHRPLAGAALDPREAAAWRQALARWLDDPALRAAWRARALARRDRLPAWSDAARTVACAAIGH